MLCAGLPKPFCDTIPCTASQTFDVPDTAGTYKSFIVGRYPKPSGEVGTGIIPSISLHKSLDLMSMQ